MSDPATSIQEPRCPTCDDYTVCGDPYHNLAPASAGGAQETLDCGCDFALLGGHEPTCPHSHVVATPPAPAESTYACEKCGRPRTKAEGGTIFTVCDDCWDKAGNAEAATLRAQIKKLLQIQGQIVPVLNEEMVNAEWVRQIARDVLALLPTEDA